MTTNVSSVAERKPAAQDAAVAASPPTPDTGKPGQFRHPSLAAALVAAQGEFPPIEKSREGGGITSKGAKFSFKYANQADVSGQLAPILARHGLGVTQTYKLIEGDMARQILVTTLLHESGEKIRSRLWVPMVGQPQEIGKTMTYMRRYSYEAIIGVSSGADVDEAHGTGAELPAARRQKGGGANRPNEPRPPRAGSSDAVGVPNNELQDWLSDMEAAEDTASLIDKYSHYYKRAGEYKDASARSLLVERYRLNKHYKPPEASAKRNPNSPAPMPTPAPAAAQPASAGN